MWIFSSLQLLLRKKAAEELKKEQERKSLERRKVIDQRCGQPKNLDSMDTGKRSSVAWIDQTVTPRITL